MACFTGLLFFVFLYACNVTCFPPPPENPYDPLKIVSTRRVSKRLIPENKACSKEDMDGKEFNPGDNYTFPIYNFQDYGVAASSSLCASLGSKAMENGGNAVDAAIVTLLCDGVVSLQGMGIGGGFLMTIWNATEKKAYFLNAREYAPAAASERIFTPANKKEATLGPKAIAIPGEIAGYAEVHEKFGKLPWSELFTDVIDLCEKGIIITPYIESDILLVKKELNKPQFRSLKDILKNDGVGDFELTCSGRVLKRPKLAETFKKIRDGGRKIFYEGEIAQKLTEDIQKAGGIITLEDFKNYRVEWKEPVNTTIKGKTLYSSATPGSGAVLVFMLNVLEDLIPVESGKSDKDMWQRIAETFKWGYARRNELGDFIDRKEYNNKKSPADCLLNKDEINKGDYDLFEQNNKVYDKDCLMSVAFHKLLSKEYAAQVRDLIDDNRTWNEYEHYNITKEGRIDLGTAHTSVLDADGSAVSVTSTINHLFGSMFVSESTGIILNNEMDDYSYPNITNGFGCEPSDFNFVRNKSSKIKTRRLRPMSSMVPTIILNEDQTVRLVVGSAGGTKITTGVTQAIIHNIFLNKNIKESLEHPRIHHNLWPMALQVEDGFKERFPDIYYHLNKTVGHDMEDWLVMRNTVAAIAVNGPNDKDACGDYRRQGGAYGHSPEIDYSDLLPDLW